MPRFAGASAQQAIGNNRGPGELKNRRPQDGRPVIQTLEEIIRDKERRVLLPGQMAVKHFYDRKDVQIFVALFIFANFIIAAVEAQLLAEMGEQAMDLIEDGNEEIHFFDVAEMFFAYAFLGELLINMYGSFLLPFFKCAWNVFDFFIVIISILSLYLKHFPGISVLRLFRAFRVVRLFGRVPTMRRIMNSIGRSLPGMSIAFSALFLIMGIYAIIGVDFWSEKFPIFFGSFFRAILTLLQIMTFDSWSSEIARDVIFDGGLVPVIYFVTYVFVASIIMINVLIALLLDQFMKAPSWDERNNEQTEGKKSVPMLDHKEDWADPREMGDDDTAGGCVIFLGDSTDPSTSDEMWSPLHKPGDMDCSPLQKPSASEKPSSLEKPKPREVVKKGRAKHKVTTNKPHVGDQKWRSKVDQNIHTLTSALAMLHTELDRLHLEVDEFAGRFEQIPSTCTTLFTPQRVAALNDLKDKFVGAISK